MKRISNSRLPFLPLFSLLLLVSVSHAQIPRSLEIPMVSQKAGVMQRIGFTDITITYHSPGVKGREIWGKLVPYGQVWRAGANDNTTIRFTHEVKIEGQPLAAGEYGLHMIPNPEEWTIIFSHNNYSWGSFFYKEAEDALRVKVKPVQTDVLREWLSYDFIDVFEIEMAEGRNFSRDFSTDSAQAYIINEKLRDMLGWETAVGKPFGDGEKPDGTVIGVMKNFHMHSFRQEIHPLFIQLSKRWSTYASARIRADHIPEAVEHARIVWEKYSANYPFDYFFLDDEFNRMYQAEEKLSEIFRYFTFLAIFIACLGLFGLASFATERKTKEIGIRKVLGASLAQLLILLSKDFIKLVIAANIISWPIVWYAMNQWLQGFAYRTSLGWTTLALTATIALVIALATVSVQTIKAALANPVESLRYE